MKSSYLTRLTAFGIVIESYPWNSDKSNTLSGLHLELSDYVHFNLILCKWPICEVEDPNPKHLASEIKYSACQAFNF